jgi:NhaA family Na+:H+ antiporter
MSGIAAATTLVTIVPAFYYDTLEWRLIDSHLFPGFAAGVTPMALVSNLLMPVFIFLIAKELYEAFVLEGGRLSGKRGAAALTMAIGAMLGAALVWQLLSALIETAEEAADATGWVVPFGSDIVLTFVLGRILYDRGHPALQVLALLCAICEITGLVMGGLMAPIRFDLSLGWLVLPLAAALIGYYGLTRPALEADATEVQHQRAFHLWRWLVLGGVSWLGVASAGLSPALGLLPLLPAVPHASRSFGMFAEAEGFLTDPLNRFAHAMMYPLIGVMFLFGLTHGGLDLPGFAATTWVTLGAYVIGKPLGVLLAAGLIVALGLGLPRGLFWRDIIVIAGLMGVGFTVPGLTMETALPGGAMQEAARLGLALTIPVGFAFVLILRAIQRKT